MSKLKDQTQQGSTDSQESDVVILDEVQMDETDEVQESLEDNYKDNLIDEDEELFGLFEAVLFLSNEPLSISYFSNGFGVDLTHVRIILDSLIDEYNERDRGIKLIEISGGFQFVSNKKYADKIRRVMGWRNKKGLSKGMLETLAIIAYKQPVVFAEIESLRGVSSRMMLANLMKKGLVKPVGRKDLPGRPLSYGTTEDFLRYLGLNKLSDLPSLSEIMEYSLENEEY